MRPPLCARCQQPVTHFDRWFQDDCPARDGKQGHVLEPKQWMALPFGGQAPLTQPEEPQGV